MKTTKPKKVSYELIPKDSVLDHPMYVLMDELIEAHHPDLCNARIALAWCTSWNPDVDGRVTLGKCKKASDLDRELVSFDFIILLRKSFWQSSHVTDIQRRALLDHELCHACIKLDKYSDPVEDERGRRVYRIRRHDIEEFTDIVARYNCYTADLERFAAALRRSAEAPFTPCDQCKDSPGFTAVVGEDGVARVTRCACFVDWSQQRQEATTPWT